VVDVLPTALSARPAFAVLTNMPFRYDHAQVLGVVVGAAVSVPVYEVIASSYGLGTEAMPAVAAVSWKATAEAMQGLSALPRWGGDVVGRHVWTEVRDADEIPYVSASEDPLVTSLLTAEWAHDEVLPHLPV